MSLESKSPEEVLKFWRELKGIIGSECTPGQLYSGEDLVEFVLTELLEELMAELFTKRFKSQVTTDYTFQEWASEINE